MKCSKLLLYAVILVRFLLYTVSASTENKVYLLPISRELYYVIFLLAYDASLFDLKEEKKQGDKKRISFSARKDNFLVVSFFLG